MPIVVGHQDAPVVAPENSMPGFDAAIAGGADGVEFDVQLTADVTPVVIHDVSLERTTTGLGQVRAASLGDLGAMRLLDADGQATQWSVPTLSEVVRGFGAVARLFVEVKTVDVPTPAVRGRETALALEAEHPRDSPMVLSFAAEALVAARDAWDGLEDLPARAIGWLGVNHGQQAGRRSRLCGRPRQGWGSSPQQSAWRSPLRLTEQVSSCTRGATTVAS